MICVFISMVVKARYRKQLLDVNKGFLPVFRAVQRRVLQFGIATYLPSCFSLTYRTYYPFDIHTKCPNLD